MLASRGQGVSRPRSRLEDKVLASRGKERVKTITPQAKLGPTFAIFYYQSKFHTSFPTLCCVGKTKYWES